MSDIVVQDQTSFVNKILMELSVRLGENNAVLLESKKTSEAVLLESKKTSEELAKIVHRANNLKQAELDRLQDKKICYKILDRIADLLERRPLVMYLIVSGVLIKFGVDIYQLLSAIKSIMPAIKIGM